MKMGVQTSSLLAGWPAQPVEEPPHGPRNHILPHSGGARQSGAACGDGIHVCSPHGALMDAKKRMTGSVFSSLSASTTV